MTADIRRLRHGDPNRLRVLLDRTSKHTAGTIPLVRALNTILDARTNGSNALGLHVDDALCELLEQLEGEARP